MAIAERVLQIYETLTPEFQNEVLDFIEFLKEKQLRISELERCEIEEVILRVNSMTETDIDPRSHEEIMVELFYR